MCGRSRGWHGSDTWVARLSLATRCIACGTVFRVVQDQLRVSSGWVRCGRCGEVFNAIESLVDLDSDRAGGAAGSVHGPRVLDELARVSRSGDTASDAPGDAATAEEDPGEASQPQIEPRVATSDARMAGTMDPEFAEAVEPNPLPLPSVLAPPTEAAAAASGELEQWRRDAALMGPAPGFVQRADRAAKWRRPWVRAGLCGVVLVAGAGLLWQIHRTHHDWVAARWPILRPAVEQLCRWSGCAVVAPRQIESLAVESSGLVRSTAAGVYRLNVTLRNRAALSVRAPAMDLVLTDASGQVVARRVLQPADLGHRTAIVEPGSELALAGLLRIQGAPVTGYTIEVFYP